MAPTKGVKRNASETKKAATAKKAAKKDPTMKAIEETIEHAKHLPLACQNMLIATIRLSIHTPSDERHEGQALVVSMVNEVIVAEEACLQEALDLAKATETSTEATRADLATKLSDAQCILAEKTKIVEEKTLANVDAQGKLADATALHSEKCAFQHAGDAAMVELQQDKAAVEKGVEKDLKAIMEGEADCEELLQILTKLQVDDSLVKALPGASARAPADRGSFDAMVLNQLETTLTQKLVDLSKAVEVEVPGAKERADAVDAAQEQLTAATSFQANAAEELATAEGCRVDASVAVKVATDALAAHEPEERKAINFREEKLVALQTFQLNTRGPFELLRVTKAAVAINEAVSSVGKETLPSSIDAAPLIVGGA